MALELKHHTQQILVRWSYAMPNKLFLPIDRAGKFISAFLVIGPIIFASPSYATTINGSCSDKFLLMTTNRAEEIKRRENEIIRLRNEIDKIRGSGIGKLIVGGFAFAFAPAIAISGVALLSPLMIYSAATTFGVMAPFTVAGGASAVVGTHILKSIDSAKQDQLGVINQLNAEIISKSRELLEIKYIQYNQVKINNLIKELDSKTLGSEFSELEGRLKVYLYDVDANKISRNEILRILSESNNSQLFCKDGFESSSVRNIEMGIETIIRNNVAVNSNNHIKKINPFIYSELNSQIKSAEYQLEKVKNQIQSVSNAKFEMAQVSNAKVLDMPEQTREQRGIKVEALLDNANIINHSLEIVLQQGANLDQLSAVETELILKIKTLKSLSL